MAEQMMAAVYRGPRQISVEPVPVPEVGPADVLIAVRGCGICGSDVHSYKLGMYIAPGQIMGHEFMGVAARVGRDVQGVREGDRVTGFSAGACGQCYWCRRGQFFLCPDLFLRSTGYGRPGAFAEYVKIEGAVPGQTIHVLPPEVDDEAGATVEPVSVGVGAIEAAGVQPGDKVVVLGAGMIGNACLQAARAAGAEQVAAVEVSPIRLEAAAACGADATFDARSGDALEWVKETIGVGRYHGHEGGMADVVVEAAGSPTTIAQAFEMVRSGGTIVFVGLPEGPAPIDVTKIVHKQPRIVGSLGGDFGSAIELLAAGRISTRGLVSHRLPLAQAPEAFEIQCRPAESIKVMVTE